MAFQTFWKSDLVTRAESRTANTHAIDQQRRETYRAVELRDGLVCRVCQRSVKKCLTLREDRLEHHHVHGRGGLDRESTSEICVVCRSCHDRRHVKRTLQIFGNADLTLHCEEHGMRWDSPNPSREAGR